LEVLSPDLITNAVYEQETDALRPTVFADLIRDCF
jgi:hypothetical protein